MRFEGFNDNWVRCNLGQIANIVGGGTPDTSNPLYWNGNINWFTPSEVGQTKYVTESKRRISEAGLSDSSAKLLPKGSILLSTRASIGLASISIGSEFVATNQGFQSIVPNDPSDTEILYYAISCSDIQKDLQRRASGSTFPEISNTEVSLTKLFLPSSQNEKAKMVGFFSILDKRIEVQNKIIEEALSLESESTP